MLSTRKNSAFTTKTVCKIAQISPRQLRYWTKIGLVKASASGARRGRQELRYNLRDMLIVLVIRDLRDKGISLQTIRESVQRVKNMWGGADPLASLRVACVAHSVVFKKEGAYVDALTGQQVFHVAVQKIRDTVGHKRCGPTERMVARAEGRFLQKVSEM